MLCFLSILVIFTTATALRIPEERIVNGKAIEISEAPYQVALLANSDFHCGGCILSKRFILTAAHCLRGRLPEDLSIVAGSKYWNRGGQRIDVEDFRANEDYVYAGPYDVGVLLLAQPLEYNSKVQPIAIAKESPKAGDTAFVSGWGSITYLPQIDPEDLHGLEIKIVKVSDDIITTKGGLENAYHGDSGGPLVVNGHLVGVVSGGDPFLGVDYPNLVSLINWIQNAVRGLKHPQ